MATQQDRPQKQESATRERDEQRDLARRSSGRGGMRRHEAADPWGNPFAMMRRMMDEMNRSFGDLGFGRGFPFAGSEMGDWSPAIEAFQRGDQFVVRAEVPGLSKDDVSVEIGDDALTIRGERRQEHEEEHEGVYRSERHYGTFCRVVPLPEGALADSAKANFKDGVLEVTLQAPSREVTRGRRIEIAEGKR